jgi:hypothetical protein
VIVKRGPLLAAAALHVLSLALPWASRLETNALWMPSFSYDTGFDYSSGYFTYDYDVQLLYGREHLMRVTGAAAAVLVFLAVRRRDKRLVYAALGVATLAIPYGLGGAFGVGRVAYVLAMAAVAIGTGLLRLPART